jgi:hypothetical protein
VTEFGCEDGEDETGREKRKEMNKKGKRKKEKVKNNILII